MNIRKTIYAFTLLMILSVNSNADYICDSNLTLQSPGFKVVWQGTATVQQIENGVCSQSYMRRFNIRDNPSAGNTYCQNGGVIQVPVGFYISNVLFNSGTNNIACGTVLQADEFKLGKVSADSNYQTWLIADGYQSIPDSHILSTYGSRSCEPNNSSNCYTKVNVVKKASGAIWCNTNGNTNIGSSYISSGSVSGFKLTSSTANCNLGTSPNVSYGTAFTIQAFDAGNSDQYTCASKYADFDRAFVAVAAETGVNCGNGYQYYKVKRPGVTQTACVVKGTYSHPIGYVIKNKQSANTTCPDGRYDVVQASGNTISNVCRESKLPSGYYLSSGNWSNTACNLEFKKFTGSNAQSDVCLSNNEYFSDYPGWYPSAFDVNQNCSNGYSFTLSKVIDNDHQVVWYNSAWVPEGYVIVPRTGSCTSPMTCNKIQVASGGMEFCHGSYAIPDGYKKGEQLTPASGSGMGCPNQMTKYRLLVDQPPPANSENLPATFKEIEPEVNSKPSNMADIGINCPGSNC